MRRWGSVPLADLAAPAAALARDGVAVNAQQAEVIHLLEWILRTTPECEAVYAPAGGAAERRRAAGATRRSATRSSASAREGAAPFYTGDIAAARRRLDRRARRDPAPRRTCAATRRSSARRCACATAAAASSRTRRRRPAGSCSRSRSGGWTPSPGRRRCSRSSRAMEEAQDERTPEFLDGLAEPGFADRSSARAWARRRTSRSSTATGRACSVTCTNGEGSGVVVPGHRDPRQQHHGRGGPQPAGLPSRARRAADAVDDVADGRHRRRRRRTSRSAPRAPTASARRCCRRSSPSSTTGCRPPRRWPSRACTSRAA